MTKITVECIECGITDTSSRYDHFEDMGWKKLNGNQHRSGWICPNCRKTTKPNMVSFAIHKKQLQFITNLVKEKLYQSRSELLRTYVKEGIKRDLERIQKMEKFNAIFEPNIGVDLSKCKRLEQ